jgi:hypothetical protein
MTLSRAWWVKALSATVADPQTVEQRERTFFLAMALFIAALTVTGFSWNIVAGRSSFDAPWWVHIHAVSFMGWLILYVLQNALVFGGRTTLHRRLGRFGAGLAAWVVLVGFTTVALTIATGRGSPAFSPEQFLAVDWTLITIFGALVAAAIFNVRRTDWHRRLMLSAMFVLSGPGIARVLARGEFWSIGGVELPRTLGGTLIISVFLILLVLVGLAFDLFNRGRVHPAYLCGIVALAAVPAIAWCLSKFPLFANFANGLAG